MVALVKALGERALSTGDPGKPWEGSPGVEACCRRAKGWRCSRMGGPSAGFQGGLKGAVGGWREVVW